MAIILSVISSANRRITNPKLLIMVDVEKIMIKMTAIFQRHMENIGPDTGNTMLIPDREQILHARATLQKKKKKYTCIYISMTESENL